MKPARPSSSSSSSVAEAIGAPSASRASGHGGEAPARFEKPDTQAISERARALWRERGCPVGRDEEIWLEAERQLIGVGSGADARLKRAS